MTTTPADSARAASIAFTPVLSSLDHLDATQKKGVIEYMDAPFPEAFDDAGEEVPGLLEAETCFIALVRELQAQATDAIIVIVGEARARTHARS